MMQHKTKIGSDFQKFAADFDDTVILEEIEFTGDKLFARFRKYARNWEVNMNRVQKNNQVQQPAMQGGDRIEVKRRG
jgi:hypothetical protein